VINHFRDVEKIHLSINKCQQYWLELAFAIMREAREDFDQQRFNKWNSIVQDLLKYSPKHQPRSLYERCLWHLFNNELEPLIKIIEEWSSFSNANLWNMRIAGLWHEIGDLEKAKNIAEKALDSIRNSLQVAHDDYELLSQESWAILLLDLIERGDYKTMWDNTYEERMDELDKYLCNAKKDFQQLCEAVNKEPPKLRLSKTVTKSYDPGVYQTSNHYPSYGYGDIDDIHPAFELIRMSEEGGVAICYSEFSYAARWIYFHAPLWSISVIMRLQNKQELERWFDRVFVASLDENMINQIGQMTTVSMKSLIKNIRTESEINWKKHLEFLPEFLSRLCFRLDEDMQRIVLILIFELISLSGDHRYIRSCVTSLVERFFRQISKKNLRENLVELILLDLDNENNRFPGDHEKYDKAFLAIPMTSLSGYQPIDDFTWNSTVDKLVTCARKDIDDIRNTSIVRLYVLFEANLLNNEQLTAFAEALWSKVDEKTSLPSLPFSNFSMLVRLPCPRNIVPDQVLKAYLLQPGITSIFDNSCRSYFKTLRLISPGLFPIDATKQSLFIWSEEELVLLLRVILALLDDIDDSYISRKKVSGLFINETHHLVVRNVLWALWIVIIPNISNLDEQSKEHIMEGCKLKKLVTSKPVD
jgi:hypothetical protein